MLPKEQLPDIGNSLIQMQKHNKNDIFSIQYLKRDIKQAAVSGEENHFLTVFYFPPVWNKAQKQRDSYREAIPASVC